MKVEVIVDNHIFPIAEFEQREEWRVEWQAWREVVLRVQIPEWKIGDVRIVEEAIEEPLIEELWAEKKDDDKVDIKLKPRKWKETVLIVEMCNPDRTENRMLKLKLRFENPFAFMTKKQQSLRNIGGRLFKTRNEDANSIKKSIFKRGKKRVWVSGPPQIGKTVLRHRLMASIIEEMDNEEMDKNDNWVVLPVSFEMEWKSRGENDLRYDPICETYVLFVKNLMSAFGRYGKEVQEIFHSTDEFAWKIEYIKKKIENAEWELAEWSEDHQDSEQRDRQDVRMPFGEGIREEKERMEQEGWFGQRYGNDREEYLKGYIIGFLERVTSCIKEQWCKDVKLVILMEMRNAPFSYVHRLWRNIDSPCILSFIVFSRYSPIDLSVNSDISSDPYRREEEYFSLSPVKYDEVVDLLNWKLPFDYRQKWKPEYIDFVFRICGGVPGLVEAVFRKWIEMGTQPPTQTHIIELVSKYSDRSMKSMIGDIMRYYFELLNRRQENLMDGFEVLRNKTRALLRKEYKYLIERRILTEYIKSGLIGEDVIEELIKKQIVKEEGGVLYLAIPVCALWEEEDVQ